MDDREFIKEQLKIYSPHLVICCGTFNIFRFVIEGKIEQEPGEKHFVSYKSDHGYYVINSYHLSYTKKGEGYTGRLIEAIQKIENRTLLRT